jgi:hypothetical protein
MPNPFSDSIHKRIRDLMNNMSDHISTGGCTDFADYSKCCGVIQGLAMAERELLDMMEALEQD